MRDGVIADLNPVGALEEACCERIVDAIWRLRRARRVERDVLLSRMFRSRMSGEAAGEELLAVVETLFRDKPDKREQALRAVHARLRKEELIRDDAALGEAFAEDAGGPNALGKLNRYETGIERRLFRNLDELRRLRAARDDRDEASTRSIEYT